MDKIKINNQVVKMRRHVKRAKLFAINKFTKQLKQLQTRKGSDSQAEKYQRKVERLLEKIKILKKMMPDFVSKKALSKEQEWNHLLTQKNIPLEDQCLALIAGDAALQKEVEKFCAEERQLVEKIPTLFLEWEVKSKMPKPPDKKKRAFDIKMQKLDKMAHKKKSNFKGATFPNNVAINRNVKKSDPKKKMLSEKLNKEVVEVNEKNKFEKLEPMEDEPNDNAQLYLESANHSSDAEAEEFFTKADESKKCFLSKKQSVSNDNVQLDLESANNSCDEEAEKFFTKAEESKKCFVSEKQSVSNKMLEAELSKDSPTNAISSDDEKRDSNCPESFILQRLKSLANTDPRKMKAKNKLNSPNTKAIKVLDLKQLQDSKLIPIQSPIIDSKELGDSLTVAPKKDSFFLNGEVESDDEESNTNSYRNFRPKRKFSDFDKNARYNNFGDKTYKSLSSFKGKDFNRNKNRFSIRKGNNFNRDDNRLRNKEEGYFNQNGSKYQKSTRGEFEFIAKEKFEKEPERDSHQFNHFNSVKRNDSFNLKRGNKKSAISNSFQSNEKVLKDLHPSWEAKNKLKEAAKSGFQGKRMVFD